MYRDLLLTREILSAAGSSSRLCLAVGSLRLVVESLRLVVESLRLVVES